MKSKLVLEIQAAYNQLTKAEKKVADYVIQNQEKVIYMSITDLADACQVGDTSVYRFCRSMNLQGYQEFKMKLSLNQEVKDEIVSNTEKGNIVDSVFQMNLSAMQETYALLSMEEVDKVLTLFEQSHRVYFFGIGDSQLTAQAACNKFLRITNKVTCIVDSHMQAMAASTASYQDLFVIVSYSGATKDNIEIAKLAKQSGAHIVCVTHFKKSPLTTYSDSILLCGANEGPLEGGSMASRVGQLFIMDVLYQKYYRRNYKECRINNEKTSSSVMNKLY